MNDYTPSTDRETKSFTSVLRKFFLFTIIGIASFNTRADVPINVTPGMLSGPLNFFSSPGGLTFASPIPYGIANNLNDVGWIWTNDNSGYLQVDFGSNTPLSRVRAYVTFAGGARGVIWAMQYSDDGSTFTDFFDYTFESKLGGGVNDDGTRRVNDFGGWYEAKFNEDGAQSHRYWRVQQIFVTISHQPRVGQMEFYTPQTLPTVKSASPSGSGVASANPIVVELEDHSTAVNTNTIVFSVNGVTVAPSITKPNPTNTTVTYSPSPGQLTNGLNTYRIIFGNNGTPSVLQTNSFSFRFDSTFLAVTPAMLSGPLEFISSPSGLTFAAPIPYGIANNVFDVGWIWPTDNSGYLQVDFGTNTTLSRVRAYVTFAGGARGAVWTIQYSDDGSTFTSLFDYTFESRLGGGVNDDGTSRADFGGWYEAKFNQTGGQAHRYWRVQQTAVTIAHHPRTGQMEFYTPQALPTVKSTSPTGVGVDATAPIVVELEDNLTAVNTNTISLSVNGVTVVPTITKTNGSLITTVTYASLGERVNGTNTVRIIFGNNAGPSVLQTNQFIFVVNLVTGPLRLQSTGSEGLLVLEAEHFDFQRVGTAATTPPNLIWTFVTAPAGFSGSGAMQALPNDPNLNLGAMPDAFTVENGPRLDFNVKFVKPGTNYIWVRGLADSAPGISQDDSLHVGLDGQLLILSKTISGFPLGAGYVWSRGNIARFENVTAGPHVVNVWMRENGMIFDKLLITSDPNYTPVSVGPDESPIGVLQQDPGADSLLVLEAESFDFQRIGSGTTTPPFETWTLVTTPAGFSGAGAMQALPNDPNLNLGSVDSVILADAARMDYNVTFVTPGTNYIWVRGLADSAPGISQDDSLHVGLDGQLLPFSRQITGFPLGAGYVWSRASVSAPARYENVTAGAHVVNVWMRENGMICDKLLLTSNPNYTPSGLGPDETRVAPAPRISLSRQGNSIVLSWPGTATLKSASQVQGPYDVDLGTANPQTITISGTQRFYRLE